MSPDRKELSQHEQEELRSVASWLNTELEGGASVWRPDITATIRTFPNPILIDLDGTLVEEGNRENINPQAEEALTRTENVGSVFIVTSGLITIGYLKRLGLASDHTVLITRQNYGWSPGRDLPPEAEESRQQYIAVQKELGRNYSEDDFYLEETGKKQLAPLFMKGHPVPLIDNSLYATQYNPGVWGIPVRTYPYSEATRSYRFFPSELVRLRTLLDTIRAVESLYAKDPAKAIIPEPYIVNLSWREGGNTRLTSVDKYSMIVLGMQDILGNIGIGLLTEITGHSSEKYSLEFSTSSAVLDGPVIRIEFRAPEKSWVFSIASSPIAQGLNHGFNWLMYSRWIGDRLVRYGNFNLEEAGRMTQRANPGLQITDVFKEFNKLLSDILP